MNRSMKKYTVTTWVVTFICIGAVNSIHGQVVINNDTVIDADNSFPSSGIDVIDGDNPPTVVDVVEGGEVGLRSDVRGSSILTVSGGSMAHVGTFDSSTINVSGGEFFAVDTDTIAALGHSSVNISGGRIGVGEGEESDWHAIHANDNSVVNISGGEILSDGLEGAVAVNDSAVINVSGGHIYDTGGEPAVNVGYGGTVNVSGGKLGFANDFEPPSLPFPLPFSSRLEKFPDGIYVDLNGLTTITGGEVDGVSVESGGKAEISGGVIGTVYAAGRVIPPPIEEFLRFSTESVVILSGGSVDSLLAGEFGAIEVHGFGLSLNDGRLTGTLADGTFIDATVETDGSGKILLVPEPSMLTLLLSGGALMIAQLSLRSDL